MGVCGQVPAFSLVSLTRCDTKARYIFKISLAVLPTTPDRGPWDRLSSATPPSSTNSSLSKVKRRSLTPPGNAGIIFGVMPKPAPTIGLSVSGEEKANRTLAASSAALMSLPPVPKPCDASRLSAQNNREMF